MSKEIKPSDTKIGWIGTGVMGKSMCMHILKEGYETLVYNRTKEKADGLIEAGAKWVDNPKDLAKKADVTGEGGTVKVMSSADAACQRLGTTTSHGKADVASIDRNEEKVATELETLARNHTAGMGGNAIVADGPVTDDGKRTYIVYKCP